MMIVLMGLFLASCGSYQQASYYDNDGIYSDEAQRVAVERHPQPARQQATDKNNVYGEYFGQKADEYGEILDSEIFTDVDSYSGVAQDSLSADTEPDYYYDPNNTYNGYGGWGDNATDVTVNVYDNWGWGGLGFGWGYPWYYNTYWGWGYPYSYYGGYYGWNSWAWGWNSHYWGYPGYWGGYYGYPYYGYSYYGYPYYHYGRGYYGYGKYAYSRSRRGIYDHALAANGLRGRSNLSSRLSNADNSRYRTNSGRSNLNTRSSYDRSTSKYRTNSTTRRSVGVDAMERNRAYRTSRSTRALPRYDSQSRNNRIYGGTARSGAYSGNGNTSRTYSNNRGTYSRTAPARSSGYSRSSTPSRSSGSSGYSRGSSNYRSSGRSSSPPRSSSYRSSGSSSRSSGAARSYSAPSRSSGTRSSGGGRRSH